jgi:hypothetical protein
MKIYADSKAAADALQDKAHAFMIAADKNYAASVAAGHTKRWAIPQRDLDDKGQPVGDWYIFVEGKLLDAFAPVEHEKLDQVGKDELAAREARAPA